MHASSTFIPCMLLYGSTQYTVCVFTLGYIYIRHNMKCLAIERLDASYIILEISVLMYQLSTFIVYLLLIYNYLVIA